MKINFSSRIIQAETGGVHNLGRRKGGGTTYPEHSNISAVAQSFDRPAGLNGKSGSVCFKGGISSKLAEIATKEKFNKAVAYVLHNESMFSALITLGIVSTIRPILTLMMPVAENKDKVAVASKEVVGGVVGYGLATLIAKPVNVAVIKLTRNPAKYIKNNNTLIKKLTGDDNYLKTFTSFWKNMPEMGTGILKATITVALMPFVIKAIDAVRGKKKQPARVMTPEEMAINQNIYNYDKREIYGKLAGGVK